MSNPRYALAPLAATLAFILGCSSSALAGKVTIRVFHNWEPIFLKAQQAFDKDFMQKHPDIIVKLENEDNGDRADKYATMAAAGVWPDILYVKYAYAQNFIRRGMFLNLTPLIRADKSWAEDDLIPIACKPFMWNGSYYGIPYDAGPVLPYYNAAMLKKIGQPPPPEDWTLDDFLTICKKATRDENGDGVPEVYGTERYWDTELLPGPLVTSFGGRYLDDDESQVLLNSTKSIEGLKWWADLKLRHDVVGAGGAFAQGKTAFTFGGSWVLSRYMAYKKSEPDVASMPAGPVRRSATVYGSGYAISRTSKNKAAAWTYLKEYLSKDGVEAMWGRTGRGSPSRYSAWPSFEKAWPGKRVGLYGKAFAYSEYGMPLSPVSVRFSSMVWRELGLVVSAKKSVENAVAAIKREGDPMLKQVKAK